MTWLDLCCEIARLAVDKKTDAFLVGGAVRDLMLGRSIHDVDAAVSGNAIAFGRALSDRIQGSFVALDGERDTCRVVLHSLPHVHADFSSFSTSIENELLRRDFTINAMAVPMRAVCENKASSTVIDPTGGLHDLEDRLIRSTRIEAIPEDPLRCLRAVRLAAQLGFEVDPLTQAQIAQESYRLHTVASERIRDELLLIMNERGAARYITWLHDLTLLDVILPEVAALKGVSQNGLHHLDVWGHTLEVVGNVECILNDLANDRTLRGSPIVERIRERMTVPLSGTPRSALVKVGALLHDIGKPACRSQDEDGTIHFHRHDVIGADLARHMCRRLKLSSDQTKFLTTIVQHHSRPAQLFYSGQITPRAVRRMFRDFTDFSLEVLLICLADRRAARGPLSTDADIGHYESFIRSLMEDYISGEASISRGSLLRGADLINELELTPGPQVGALLREVEEAQLDGIVSSREEALEYARHRLEQKMGSKA